MPATDHVGATETMENLAQGKVVNQIKVPQRDAQLARVALERMLAVS